MTVQRWEQPTMTLTPARDVIDGWATQVASIAKLADYIAPTAFVPGPYRNQPAAIAAAILAGREMGIGPMASLQHLHVIDGRPAMSAQLMRALVMAAGHTLRVIESTNARCVITGHRKGEATDREPVTYTIEDARAAGLQGRQNWRNYPRAMLLARATAEICRRDYPDVIQGMAYTVEEAQDMDGQPLDLVTPTGTPRKTVQRSQRRPSASTSTPSAGEGAQGHQAAATPAAVQPGGPPAPPLPEDAPAPPAPQETPVSRPEDQGAPPHQDDAEEAPQGWETASAKQMGHVFALLGELGQVTPRDRRLQVVSALVGRPLQSMAQLTRAEATPLIDTLVRISQGQAPDEELTWLVDEGTQRLAELDAAADPNQTALWDPSEGQEP